MGKEILQRFSSREIHKKIISRPWAVILIVAAVTLLFALQIPQLSFQTSVYDLVIEDLPQTRTYHDFKKQYGSEEIILIVAKADNFFDPKTFNG